METILGWSLRSIKMQEEIYFIALQLCLIPVLQSWNLILQTSYLYSLTEALEWSIVLWLVNHSKSLNGQ